MNSNSHGQFLGIWSSSATNGLACQALHHLLREGRGRSIHAGASLRIIGFGIDRWPGPNFLSTAEGRAQLILGEPVYTPGLVRSSRTKLLSELNDNGPDALEFLLKNCQGTFCGFHWSEGRLQLFSDKIGVRGVYLSKLQSGELLFSSSQTLLTRFLRQMDARKFPDDRGIAEWISLGFSAGGRTLSSNIQRLREAQIAAIDTTNRLSRRSYHLWRDCTDYSIGLGDAAKMVEDVFQLAVKDRLAAMPNNESIFAFLSGGMDSRLVVGTISSRVHEPLTTVNIAPKGTLDAVLGDLVSKTIGTDHHHVPLLGGWSATMESAVQGRHDASGRHASGLWWSGDGGSVGLGHVYLTKATTIEAPANVADLAQIVLRENNWQMVGKAVSKEWRRLCEFPKIGVTEELQRLSAFSLDRAAFAFLIFNDQQRHLDWHFDGVENRSFDLVLPFFDARLLTQVLTIPMKHLIHHRLYNKIFSNHSFGSVPWQAYPGHEPCPHPLPEGLRQQWQDGWYAPSFLASKRRQHALNCIRRLMSGPRQIHRGRVLLASLLTLVGIRDFSYILSEADKLFEGYGSNAH